MGEQNLDVDAGGRAQLKARVTHIEHELGPVHTIAPRERGVGALDCPEELPGECGVRAPEPQRGELGAHHMPLQVCCDLVAREAMTVDVTPHPGRPEQIHVVATGEQAHVVDLRHAWDEKLDQPCE